MKCGKFAGYFIAREGMWYPCARAAGHDGQCQRGGTCYTHGEYVGDRCPTCPPFTMRVVES